MDPAHDPTVDQMERQASMQTPDLALDTSVPVLLVKHGRYPYHHGALGIVRSLGRVGVPTYAITEDRLTPLARSRYLTGRFPPPSDGSGKPEALVAHLLDIGRRIGRPTVAIPTDDGAAVLLAEHAAELGGRFLIPGVAPDLPRTLASKQGMYELCRRHGVPTPQTVFPTSVEEVVRLARELTFPVIAKNVEPWAPRPRQHVKSTTIIHDERDLLDRFRDATDLTGLLLQEYIPHDQSEDWFVALHSNAAAVPEVQFIGQKARAWPPRSGVTADGRAAPNPTLAAITTTFVKELGWQGPAWLDWRLDLRDGRYLLVDFNVRLGAGFRCGQTHSGVDVVRALHLDLTGRSVPTSGQDYSRRLVVGNLLVPTFVGERIAHVPPPPPPPSGSQTEHAWFAADDPAPAITMLVRGIRPVAAAMMDNWNNWRRQEDAARSPLPSPQMPM
jgi:D-aspartate ligase